MSITTEEGVCLDSSDSSTDVVPSSDVRHNLGRSMGDAASFGVMVGLGETYLPAFALAMGMGEATSGLVASLPVVAGGVMQLVSLRAMKFFGNEQRWVVICATIQALSFIPLILAALYGSIALPLLLLIASVYWASGLASGPAWNTWMDSIVPVGVRARYFRAVRGCSKRQRCWRCWAAVCFSKQRRWADGLCVALRRCSVAPLWLALFRLLAWRRTEPIIG